MTASYGCSIDTSTYGSCYSTGSDTVTTYYNNYAGSGAFSPVSSATSALPLTSNILQSNARSGQWLITCPMTPNELNTTEYFSSNNDSFMLGDRCLANSQPLSTTTYLDTNTYWSLYSLASTSINFNINNIGQAFASVLAYSGQAATQGEGYNIANGYNSKSYIYDSVPSSNQSALWTWNAKYANLKEFGPAIKKGDFYNSKYYSGLQYRSGPFSAISDNTLWVWYCNYVYNYQDSSDLTLLNNTNITIAAVNPSPPTSDYIEYMGVYSHPVSFINLNGLCAWDLASGSTMYCGSGWHYVGAGRVSFRGSNKGADIYTSTRYPGDYVAAYWVTKYGLVPQADTVVAPIASLHYRYVPALPYFLYDISMPALYSTVSNKMEYLNLSFDMYSAHNYIAPANYLDAFPLYTGSAFFANYSDNLTAFNSSAASLSPSLSSSFNPISNLFLSSMGAGQLLGVSNIFSNLLNTVGSAGGYAYLGVRSPQFIAASPNDYVYVINYTNTCGFACFTGSSNAYLYTFRFIPQGYYNLSNDQPNTVPQQNPSTWSTWNSLWASYWQNAVKEQSSNLYLVGVTDLTSSSSSWWGFQNSGVIPTSVTSDYSDDVFFIGDYAGSSNKFFIGALFPDGTKRGASETQPSGFMPSQEFAVSPGGQELYLANEHYPGSIVLYGSPSFSYQGTINMSYSNSTYNMSITAYLAHGGPFGSSEIAQAYLNAPATNDIAGYHYPIAITDQKGLLYVFDLWSFTVGNMPSSLLTLRVFSANNTELPINGQNFTTMFPANSEAISTSQGTPITEWPPYGWVLAANISIGNNQYVSYCAAGCTYTPSSTALQGNPYPPIGPWISAGGATTVNPQSVSISTSFNGTFNMIAHVNSWSTQIQYSCIKYGTGRYPPCLEHGYVTQNSKGPPLYTELLTFQPTIDNYTKTSLTAYSPYACYVNASGYAGGACTYNAIVADAISKIWPPFLSVPSSFSYVAGEGSPEAYLTLTNTLSALFPQQTSSPSETSAASSEASSGISSSGSVSPGTIASISSASPNLYSQPSTYLNSSISGYVLIPYNYSYYLYQNWQEVSATPDVIEIESVGTPSDTFNSPVACSSITNTASSTYQGYTAAQVPLQGSTLNETIQGGPTYLQYVARNTYYAPNVSDAGVIMLPYIHYHMFTNRNYGEVFVNQTVNASLGALSPQLVINASGNYDYAALSYNQSAFGNTYPGYMAEQALPQQLQGAGCGSQGCPTPYYYAQNLFSGNNRFSYGASSTPGFTQLFDVYQKASFINRMVLNMSHDPKILGYNRLLFTYVDTFNNTIYMPLDVDFSNITSLMMNITPIVSTTNANETTINVNGTLLSTTPFGIEPLPNAKVFIYYDTNINYYNSTVPQSSFSSMDLNGYFANDLRCAFGNASNCTLANPLATITQPGNAYVGGTSGSYEASYIDYAPQFNTAGACPPEPKSLLATSTVKFQCNIYGYNGLQAARYNASLGYYQYCLPYFLNGTGMFTSQLGLADVATTNANGAFAASITACGTENARIIAQYYGNPQPEPTYVIQSGLSFSTPGTNMESSTLEYNYTTSPSELSESTQIGNFMLSYGNINLLLMLALEASIVVAVLYVMPRRRSKKRIVHD
ncbi:MAG: hypothetical protein ACP5UH_02550 [Candidatus Micrarchaeia archaeon]